MDWYIEECTASEVDEYEEVSNGNAGDYTEYSDWEQDDIDDGAEEKKDDILRYFHDHEKFRRTIERSISRHRDRTVTMMCVPDSLAYTGDGRFLHVQSQDMHIYYNESVIRLAYMNGLEALVADGMFSMHPDGKQKNSQLYTIHGVCNGKVNVPLLFALTNKKTEAIYFIIWSTLKGVLDRVAQSNDNTLRVVVDFEKAPINSLRRDTWLTGPFADLWNKWQVIVLRTTNIAENFHSKLSKATNFRRPTLKKLIEIFHGCTAEGKGKLLQHQQAPAAEQHLRCKDFRRRRKVCEVMDNFERLMQERLVTTYDAEHYCRKMSKIITLLKRWWKEVCIPSYATALFGDDKVDA
ncbi:unnamed protein product [Heligmosomoides polygyrus]|uniref:MULE domain-containing protein n=1 Tax=Heligmosomoides polygyrus TaxID=6339 RepID=A0A183GUG9_HELPZ|nr:unnamed protein product [Heligmosomoides polygyrus]